MITLAAGQEVPWHWHSNVIDRFFCMQGPMVIETRAPREVFTLSPGETCANDAARTSLVHPDVDCPSGRCVSKRVRQQIAEHLADAHRIDRERRQMLRGRDAERHAALARFAVERLNDIACKGADILYTDVWASRGQEAEAT